MVPDRRERVAGVKSATLRVRTTQGRPRWRGRGAPRRWCCRPARGPDRRPSCRPGTGTAWVPWRISCSPLIHQIKCYTNHLKSHAERVRPQVLSLRQHRLCGQSLRPPIGPEKAQEFAHFQRTAVHLALARRARNLSLAPGFLRGCSLGPFGTPSVSSRRIKKLRISTRRRGLSFLSGEREQAANSWRGSLWSRVARPPSSLVGSDGEPPFLNSFGLEKTPPLVGIGRPDIHQLGGIRQRLAEVRGHLASRVGAPQLSNASRSAAQEEAAGSGVGDEAVVRREVVIMPRSQIRR